MQIRCNVCNNKQPWNKDKCSCECKQLIATGRCYEGFIWNPRYCVCECDKPCDAGEYLDHGNCKLRKKLIDKLVNNAAKILMKMK